MWSKHLTPQLVSVIIPTHNRSKLLRVAVESVLAQTYPNIEAMRPAAGLVHCGYYHIDEAGNRVGKIVFLPEGEVLKELVCRNFI